MSHIENEIQNMIRIEQNLYPQESLFGFTKLNAGGVLIRWIRKFEDAQGVVREEVVIVSEVAYKTECVICMTKNAKWYCIRAHTAVFVKSA